MTLRDYLAIARSWWWLVVLGVGLGGGSAYAVTTQMTPIYRARAVLLVNQAQNPAAVTYQDILGSQQLTKTYAELVTSNVNLRVASEELDDQSLNAAALKKKVSASDRNGTQLVVVYAEDSSPKRAALIANGVADSFIKYVEKAQLAGKLGSTSVGLNTVFVAETAEPPDSPVRPNRVLNVALGVLLGLIIVIAVVAVVEYLDDYIDSRGEVEQRSLTFLGTIFHTNPPRGVDRQAWVPSITADVPNSLLAESFRQVQTNLAFSLSVGEFKTLVVTSPGPGEGKSTVAANLADALAESAKRVLLVDGDLRKPDVHRYFKLPNRSGLSTAFLADPTITPSVIKKINSHLFVLTSGPVAPNPAELLNSARMRTLLANLCASFDVIIVDSPPILGLADAAIWAGMTDGVLLVARRGKTRRGPFEEAIAAVRTTNKPIVGVIVNDMKRARSSAFYPYGYGYGKEGVAPGR